MQAQADGADYVGTGAVYPTNMEVYPTNMKLVTRKLGIDGLKEVCSAPGLR